MRFQVTPKLQIRGVSCRSSNASSIFYLAYSGWLQSKMLRSRQWWLTTTSEGTQAFSYIYSSHLATDLFDHPTSRFPSSLTWHSFKHSCRIALTFFKFLLDHKTILPKRVFRLNRNHSRFELFNKLRELYYGYLTLYQHEEAQKYWPF